MPMTQVRRNEAISKDVFHKRLQDWLHSSHDNRVGSESVQGNTPWVFVRDGSQYFHLNADTTRQAVERYLQFVAVHGDDLEWEIVPSQRGNMTALVYGPERIRYKPFYFYAVSTIR